MNLITKSVKIGKENGGVIYMGRRDYKKSNMIPRDTRIGLDEKLLMDKDINLSLSHCDIYYTIDEKERCKIQSILDISQGGTSIVIYEAPKPPEEDLRLDLTFKGEKSQYNLKGRIVWVKTIAGDNFWLGVDLRFTTEMTAFYNLLSIKD